MLTGYVESWVSLGRINTFLQQTEVIDRYEEGAATAINDDVSYVGFHNATFAWLKDVPAESEQRNFKLHFDGDVRFPNGKVSIVAGQTGSGKTSLLMALLGEMHFESRGADSNFSLPRSGGVAYASQQSWLQNRTLRDNILFGAEFDEERYNKVVKHCALERDFTLFDAGDKTEVGEKGLTLSGGQKARVTLARAIYSRASILLLDDILSASVSRTLPLTSDADSFHHIVSFPASTSTPPSSSSTTSSRALSSRTERLSSSRTTSD